jgi:arginyl-tRNA synthetase
MATDGNALAQQLQQLGINNIESYPNCHPDTNPVDIYRSHITSLLAPITGVDPAIIYPAIQWTQTLDKGDAILAVPALRVKGKKPQELAEEWASKVRRIQLLLSTMTDPIP